MKQHILPENSTRHDEWTGRNIEGDAKPACNCTQAKNSNKLRLFSRLPRLKQSSKAVFSSTCKIFCVGILLIWSIKWSLFTKIFAQMNCKSRDKFNDDN